MKHELPQYAAFSKTRHVALETIFWLPTPYGILRKVGSESLHLLTVLWARSVAQGNLRNVRFGALFGTSALLPRRPAARFRLVSVSFRSPGRAVTVGSGASFV